MTIREKYIQTCIFLKRRISRKTSLFLTGAPVPAQAAPKHRQVQITRLKFLFDQYKMFIGHDDGPGAPFATPRAPENPSPTSNRQWQNALLLFFNRNPYMQSLLVMRKRQVSSDLLYLVNLYEKIWSIIRSERVFYTSNSTLVCSYTPGQLSQTPRKPSATFSGCIGLPQVCNDPLPKKGGFRL